MKIQSKYGLFLLHKYYKNPFYAFFLSICTKFGFVFHYVIFMF